MKCFHDKCKGVAAILLAAALMLVSLSGCVAEGVEKIRLSGEDVYIQQSAGDSFHLTDEENLSLIKTSSFLELYFDSVNADIAVKNTRSGKFLYSLSAEAGEYGLSSAFYIKITGPDGREYSLNSQDNCACFGSYKTDFTQDGVSITYSLALNSEDAVCGTGELPEGALRADIPILYTLDGEALCVGIDCSAIFVSDGYRIEDIDILPGLACSVPEEDDYFILPDGCGALADIYSEAQSDVTNKYYTYGADSAANEDGAKAYIPFFAFRYGKTAVCVTAEEGEAAVNFIYCRRAGEQGAAVYPELSVTQTVKDEKHLYSGISYDGSVELRYTFLGNDSCSYTDLATICRERLIRSCALKTGTLELQSSIPFLLTAVGAGSSDKDDSYTEFSEAMEILSILKAKGVNNIAMRYTGTLDGGLSQEKMSGSKLLSFLGSENDLKQLTYYANVQDLEVFFEVDLLSSEKSDAVTALNGEKIKASYNPVLDMMFDTDILKNDIYLSSLSELDDNVAAAVSRFNGMGISLGDVSRTVYSDYSEGLTKQESADMISDTCKAFGANGSVMISGPALYLLINAKYVDEMPMKTEYAHDDDITAIPFLQIVLHGTVYYAGEALNESGDIDYSVLKCIEYGCIPSALLTYKGLNTVFDTYYVNLSPELAAVYERMNAELGDLYDKRITAHTKVFDDVYCTEYANKTLVYVNYSDESVEINGLTLEAKDYMRVN